MDATSGNLGRAVERLNAERQRRPEVPLTKLVDEIAQHFDLNAMDSEWLLRSTLKARQPGKD